VTKVSKSKHCGFTTLRAHRIAAIQDRERSALLGKKPTQGEIISRIEIEGESCGYKPVSKCSGVSNDQGSLGREDHLESTREQDLR